MQNRKAIFDSAVTVAIYSSVVPWKWSHFYAGAMWRRHPTAFASTSEKKRAGFCRVKALGCKVHSYRDPRSRSIGKPEEYISTCGRSIYWKSLASHLQQKLYTLFLFSAKYPCYLHRFASRPSLIFNLRRAMFAYIPLSLRSHWPRI